MSKAALWSLLDASERLSAERLRCQVELSVQLSISKPDARLNLSARRVKRYVTVATVISCTNLGTLYGTCTQVTLQPQKVALPFVYTEEIAV